MHSPSKCLELFWPTLQASILPHFGHKFRWNLQNNLRKGLQLGETKQFLLSKTMR